MPVFLVVEFKMFLSFWITRECHKDIACYCLYNNNCLFHINDGCECLLYNRRAMEVSVLHKLVFYWADSNFAD